MDSITIVVKTLRSAFIVFPSIPFYCRFVFLKGTCLALMQTIFLWLFRVSTLEWNSPNYTNGTKSNFSSSALCIYRYGLLTLVSEK